MDDIVEIDVRSRRAERLRRFRSEKGVDLRVQSLELLFSGFEHLLLEVLVSIRLGLASCGRLLFRRRESDKPRPCGSRPEQVSYSRRFADGVENLDEPRGADWKVQGLVVLG